MLMMDKYLEGTIFLNFLLEGVSGVIGVIVASYIYDKFKLRGAFVVSLGITLVGAELIYAFQEGILDPSIVVNLGLSTKSDLPENSLASKEFYLDSVIPILGFIAKIGISVSF